MRTLTVNELKIYDSRPKRWVRFLNWLKGKKYKWLPFHILKIDFLTTAELFKEDSIRINKVYFKVVDVIPQDLWYSRIIAQALGGQWMERKPQKRDFSYQGFDKIDSTYFCEGCS